MIQTISQKPLAAVGMFSLAILLIAVVDTTCKAFTDELHAFQLVWGYFLGVAITISGYFTARRRRLGLLFATRRRALQICRPALLAGSVSTLFLALTYLPIAEVTVIGFTAPLFITALSVLMLKERVGPHRWAAVALGLAGVLIVVQPGGALWHWYSIMPLVSAMFFAVFQIVTRMLARTESSDTTLIHTGLGALFWTSLLAPLVWTQPEAHHWLVFLGTGFLGAFAHMLVIAAFRRGEASLIAPFNYTKLVWVVMLGYLVFGDIPRPETWIGSGVIVAAGCYVLYRERRRQ